MTIEKAAEIISRMMDEDDKMELFNYFVNVFNIQGKYIIMFAEMCGYLIAVNVRIAD